jgi:hypothetical protein
VGVSNAAALCQMFRRSSAFVATNQEGHRTPQSDRASTGDGVGDGRLNLEFII